MNISIMAGSSADAGTLVVDGVDVDYTVNSGRVSLDVPSELALTADQRYELREVVEAEYGINRADWID